MAKPWPEWKCDRLIKLWREPDISVSAMASRLGVTEASINSMAQKLGLPPRKPGNQRKASAAKAA